MKHILLLLFILVGFSCLAQTPEGINYQAIARDNSGAEYANTTLSVKFSISSDAIGTTIIFTETHNTVATNDFGLFNLVLGNVNTVDFTSIDWSNAPLYLIVEADFGSGFEQMGNPTPIVAVPYALYAKNVENNDDADADSTNELISSFSIIGTNVEITEAGVQQTVSLLPLLSLINNSDTSATNEIQVLSISNDTIFLSNGGFVPLPASTSGAFVSDGTETVLNNIGDNVGIGTLTPTAKLEVTEDIIVNQITVGKGSGNIPSNTANGYQALSFNTTGQWNTANGYQALFSNTIGFSNTALGNEALSANSTGIWNTAVGDYALGNNDTGEKNTAVGVYALPVNNGDNNTALGLQALVANTSGDANIALGNFALNTNASGSNNTSVGFEAGYSAAGSNNLFLGYRAGYSETGSNKLYIESSNSTTPLIYGEFINDILRVNGTLQVGDPTVSGYALPTIDGSNGQVLTTDASGNVTWQSGGIDADGDLWPAGMDADDSDNNVKFPSQINDLDNDTKIQLEESANENIIRFDLAGTEKWAMHGSRLEPMNTGHSLFIGQGAGANDDLINRYNVLIGDSAGYNNVGGTANTSIGSHSLYENINGNFNTATGFRSLSNNTNSDNTAHGALSLNENIIGDQNTVQGSAAMRYNTSGSRNTAMGYYSLSTNIIGTSNTAIGYQAGKNSIGNYNIFLGFNAGLNETGDNKLYIESSSSSAPLIYGDFANDSLKINGTLSVIDGTQGANKVLTSDAAGNATWQTPSVAASPWAKTAGNIHQTVLTDNVGFGTTTPAAKLEVTEDILVNGITIGKGGGSVNLNTALGSEALVNNTTGNDNTANGYRALYSNINGQSNTAFGGYSLYENTSGSYNAASGQSALRMNTSGIYNTASGWEALQLNTTGSYNTAIGNGALGRNIIGEYNTALGVEAGNEALGSNNIFLGYRAGYNETGSDKLYIESSSSSTPLIYGDFGNDLVRVNGIVQINDPSQSGYVLPASDGTAGQILETDGAGNASWQTPAAAPVSWELSGNAGTVTGTDFIGTTDAQNLDIRTNNIIHHRFTQKGQLEFLNTGSSIYIGSGAGLSDDQSNNGNVGIGDNALLLNTNGYSCVALGNGALNGNTTGEGNTAIGSYALVNAASFYNTAIGERALFSTTSGSNNFSGGKTSMFQNTSGSSNVAVGAGTLFSNTTGDSNTGVGSSAGNTNTTGNSNTLLGYFADVGSNNLTNATAVGANTIVQASNSLILGNNANVGIGTSNPTAKLEVTEDIKVNGITLGIGGGSVAGNTAIGNIALSSNSTGVLNTAIGNAALLFNTIGNQNTAIGNGALHLNTEGNENTANGSDALFSNITGNNNTANGIQALSNNSTGDNNTGNGNGALHENITGNNNTVAGYNAGWHALGDNNLFLGYQAGYNETGSNKLYIETSNSTTPLIYGEFDNDILRVNGTLQVGDPTGSGYALPTADGATNGEVLTTDAFGNVTWQDASPKIGFHAGSNPVADQVIPGGGTSSTVSMGTGINFFNDGNGYNVGSNSFTPPVPGVYQLNCHISYSATTPGEVLQVFIDGPGGSVARSIATTLSSGIISLSAIVNSAVRVGPYSIKVYSGSDLIIEMYDSHFSGALLYKN